MPRYDLKSQDVGEGDKVFRSKGLDKDPVKKKSSHGKRSAMHLAVSLFVAALMVVTVFAVVEQSDESDAKYSGRTDFRWENMNTIHIGPRFDTRSQSFDDGWMEDWEPHALDPSEEHAWSYNNHLRPDWEDPSEADHTKENVIVDEGIKRIGAYTFSNNPDIKNVVLPESLVCIGNNAFADCTSLTSITLPSNLQTIEWNAFKNCTSLTTINIPSTVTIIGDVVFDGCKNLKTVYFNADEWNVTDLLGKHSFRLDNDHNQEPCTFYSANNYASEKLNNVNTLGETTRARFISSTQEGINWSIAGNKLIISENTHTSDPSQAGVMKEYMDPMSSDNIEKYPIEERLPAWHFAPTWKQVSKVMIKSGVKNIGSYAFYFYDNIKEVDLSDAKTLKSIGDYALGRTYSLTAVDLESATSLKSIGVKAFDYCELLTKINIPASVTRIGESAFSGCHSVNFIEFNCNDWNIELGPDAFSLGDMNHKAVCTIYSPFNSALGNVPLGGYMDVSFKTDTDRAGDVIWSISGNTITFQKDPAAKTGKMADFNYPDSPGWYSAYSWSNVNRLVIASDVEYIGSYAFENNASIESFDFSKATSLTTIGRGAFEKCVGLTDVDLSSANSLTTIGKDAFLKCEKLSSVKFPDSLVTIGEDSFSGCTAIKTITIPSSTKTISEGAFQKCTGLAVLDVSSAASLESIKTDAFSGCKGIGTITIPATVKEIGARAFLNCNSVDSVYFDSDDSKSIKIGKNAFSLGTLTSSVKCAVYSPHNNANGLLGESKGLSTTFSYFANKDPEGGIDWRIVGDTMYVSKVEGTDGAMVDHSPNDIPVWTTGPEWKKVENVVIEEGVTYIGAYSFYNSYFRNVIIPSTVTSIGAYAFSNCGELASVTIHKGITTIPEGAFSSCKSIRNIMLHDSITSIGASAFAGCSGLVSIYCLNPAGITSIGVDAFSLSSDGITTKCTFFTPNNKGDGKIDKTMNSNANIAYGSNVEGNIVFCLNGVTLYLFKDPDAQSGEMNNYTMTNRPVWQSVPGWSMVKEIIIEEGVTSIGNSAFYRLPIVSVSLPSTLKTIGPNSFSFSFELSSIVIPDSVTTIGNSAFSWNRFKAITMPATVENIDFFAFGFSTTITTIYFTGSTWNIGDLKPLTFGSSGLIKVYSENNIAEGKMERGGIGGKYEYIAYSPGTQADEDKDFISWSIIDGELTISKVTVTDGASGGNTMAISDWKTYDAWNDVRKITIADGVTTIGANAFTGCKSLKSVVIPGSVTYIGKSAFEGCINLESVDIKEGVHAIGVNAFKGCRSLRTVVIPNSLAFIGEGAFELCTGMNAIVFGAQEWNNIQIEDNAFYVGAQECIVYSPHNVADGKLNSSAGTAKLTYAAYGEKANWRWLNYDGTVLQIDFNVDPDQTPTLNGKSPEHPDGLTFDGWKSEDVDNGVVKTAQFQNGDDNKTIADKVVDKTKDVVDKAFSWVHGKMASMQSNIKTVFTKQ